MEERLAKVEGILEEVRARLNHLEAELAGLRDWMRDEIGGLRQELSGLRREMYTNFRWTLAIMISMWVTIILAIVFSR
jgi:predicted nuclease with TOPRIM domain